MDTRVAAMQLEKRDMVSAMLLEGGLASEMRHGVASVAALEVLF